MMLFFWIVTLCGLTGRYQRLRAYEDGGSIYIRNVGYESTGVTTPEEQHCHLHRRQNFKYDVILDMRQYSN
jgi:hypothetical protein